MSLCRTLGYIVNGQRDAVVNGEATIIEDPEVP